MNTNKKDILQSYANEITEYKVEIIKILEESEQNATSSTNMLRCQSEVLTKIDNQLDCVHEELKMSDKIVRGMMSFFTFFPKKILGKDKIKTNTSPTKKEISNATTANNSDHRDQYYDEVYEYLNRLKNQALIHREILDEHSIAIDNISKKTNIASKNIKIIESNMKKI